MPSPLTMPQLGITMTEGKITRWLKREGDTVVAGEPVCEIETDKISTTVEATTAGTLGRILVPEGASAPVAAPIALILAPGEALEGPAGATPAESPMAPAPPARPGAEPAAHAATALAAPAAASATAPVEAERIRATPLARRLAEELGVDLRTVRGSGPGGRIVEADVRRAAAQRAAPAAPPPTAPTAPAAPPPAAPAIARTLPLTGMRRTIARRMLESLQQSAQLTLTTEADATELVAARARLAEDWQAVARAQGQEARGPSYNDLLIKLCARALTEHPMLNARLSGEQIELLAEIHIGLAVALDDGLIVPVVRNAHQKDLRQIAAETAELVQRARAGTLTLDDITGGTFTITNLGMYDVDFFTPILNPPECAILGVGRIVDRLVPSPAGPVTRKFIPLSLTFDHRIVDGAPAARFLQRIKQLIEDPVLAL
jgi:pyruvate dehydrogenase E2 component (dihydrolipoamide acetyltransferase)